ncbi:MAG: hypothetical protein JWO91_107 [Acidobacteriaceae bacterium]|jgi:hypothetical protein|nr:hypothetical protein [Acidobacteriaceae bacterium]
MMNVGNEKSYCDQCGIAVGTKEGNGDKNTAQMRHVLVGECGHVLAERLTRDDSWGIAA